MRLRKKRSTYKIPPIGQLLNAFLEVNRDDTFKYEMRHMDHDEFLEHRDSKILGQPRKVCIINGGKEILVWPVPDRTYDLTIRYYPPAKEL